MSEPVFDEDSAEKPVFGGNVEILPDAGYPDADGSLLDGEDD